MEAIQINEKYLKPLASSKFLYGENPNYDAPECSIPVSIDTLQKYNYTPEGEEKSILEHCLTFCRGIYGKSFDSSHPAWKNFAYVIFQGDNLKRFYKPQIIREGDQLILFQGYEKKEKGYEAVRTPIIVQDGKLTFKGSEIPRLGLSSIDVEQQNREKLKLPMANFKINDQVYLIPVKVPTENSYFNLVDAWEEAKDGSDESMEALVSMVSPLYGVSAKLGDMFSAWFIGKRFPENGIVLPVNGMTKSRIENAAKDGKKASSFMKYSFTLDHSLIPEPALKMRVLGYGDGENQEVELGEVYSFSATDNYEAVSPHLQGDGVPTPEKPWYVWVKEAGNNPNQKPVHQCYATVQPPKVLRILNEDMSRVEYIWKQSEAAVNYDNNPL